MRNHCQHVSAIYLMHSTRTTTAMPSAATTLHAYLGKHNYNSHKGLDNDGNDDADSQGRRGARTTMATATKKTTATKTIMATATKTKMPTPLAATTTQATTNATTMVGSVYHAANLCDMASMHSVMMLNTQRNLRHPDDKTTLRSGSIWFKVKTQR